jgi:hypothetical protein
LISVGEAIHLIEKPDHREHFSEAFNVKSQPLHGGGVRINSVGAAVGNGDRQGDDFLGEQVDLPGLHDRLEPGPTKLQVFRVRGQGAPDVGDAIDLLGRFNVIEDCSNLRMIAIFIHQFHSAHILLILKCWD